LSRTPVAGDYWTNRGEHSDAQITGEGESHALLSRARGVTAGEASAFFGEWAGVPASDFHAGDAISGTFTYDPAVFTGQAVGPLTTAFVGGTLHFDWQIGSHHFSFEGPLNSPAGPMNTLTLSIFAAPPQSYGALALDYVGDLQGIYTDYAVGLRLSDPNLFGDHNDLASVNFFTRMFR